MNWLDILPQDIKKIIDKKVQDIHIKERRIERKKNRAENRLLKHKADVREKFVRLVEELYNYNYDEDENVEDDDYEIDEYQEGITEDDVFHFQSMMMSGYYYE